ncbi:MAG TPA: hypothetical protein VHK06_01810, partial [Candidatus Limnocylindria bacterium]|nr:hypothetical protein [Candidatus Limnocylindria bacterium]
LAASAPGALSGIAAQLRDSAAAAETFAARRRDAEATVRAFADALDAIERRRPREALRAADRAEARLEAVAAWERASRLVTLRFWLDTMGALLDASRRAAQATLDGDSAEAAAAVRDWRAAAEEAHRADVALGVAIAEGGSSVTAPPLQRLARALAELDEAQTLVASLVHPSTARSPSGRAP